jgi:hypothetical protein
MPDRRPPIRGGTVIDGTGRPSEAVALLHRRPTEMRDSKDLLHDLDSLRQHAGHESPSAVD